MVIPLDSGGKSFVPKLIGSRFRVQRSKVIPDSNGYSVSQNVQTGESRGFGPFIRNTIMRIAMTTLIKVYRNQHNSLGDSVL